MSQEPDQDIPTQKIKLNPSLTHQQMIGFGGALTWYADRISSSPKKDEISQLIFDDLGADIIRLKNWYFPEGYPENKSPDQMEVSWFVPHFNATNELYDLAKSHNSKIEVLLSSWTPPSSLKSNGELEEGTLKKNDDGEFVYDEFAQYWVDVLNHIDFQPDYLSIQNEPTYTTDQWETCAWSATETSNLPGYATALDLVHQRLETMQNPPQIIGPESQDLQSGPFDSFADVLSNKEYVAMYGYHPYNFTNSTSIEETKSYLNNIKQFYDDKPNIMTEYSGMSWMKTAQFITNVLIEANATGYIYWELIWDENASNAMVKVDSSGDYELTPFYYVMKHFAKHVDKGYQRIGVESENSTLFVSGFSNPEQDQLTLVVVNPHSNKNDILLEVEGHSGSGIKAFLSQEGNFYQERSVGSADKPLSIPSNSITTVTLDL
ncbi:MAG: glycoside hydrolase family 30 beta sandwich domain-containing protein [Balneolaceae bacterium]|nr:glycoside hydrolase family 30 beta sandwich domain-containing protein [Balneolaceae bacterium]